MSARKFPLKWTVLLFIVGLGIAASYLVAQQSTPTPEPMTLDQAHELMRKVREWDVTVDANVIDDAGDPVGEILVISRAVRPGNWDVKGTRESIRTTDQKLHMEFKDVMVVTITFQTSGMEEMVKRSYEPYELVIDTKDPPPATMVDIQNGTQHLSVDVVLNRIPDQKEVLTHSGYLKYEAADEHVIFLMDMLEGRSPIQGYKDRFLFWDSTTERPDYDHLYIEVVDAPGTEATYHPPGPFGTVRLLIPVVN